MDKIIENKKAILDAETSALIGDLENAETWGMLMQLFYKASESLHPCKNGDLDAWEVLVDRFKEIYPVVKNWHRGPGGDYTAETPETAEQMIGLVDAVNRCSGLGIEIVGRFIWSKGKQKEHAATLKELGFTHQKNKNKWCRSYDGYQKKNGKRFSYAQIKSKYQEQENAV